MEEIKNFKKSKPDDRYRDFCDSHLHVVNAKCLAS